MPPPRAYAKTKVLVLMAARNGSAWIGEQIATILSQEHVSIDLLISEDHSTDDTASVINRFLGDSRVQVLSPPTPTGSAAKNFFWLMQHAPLDDHEYIALADQDDIWYPGKTARAVSKLRESGAAGYSCAVTAIWPNGRKRTLRQISMPTALDFLFEGAGQGCTFVLTAAFFFEVKRFIEAEPICISQVHYHDWTVYALARSWRKVWHFDPYATMEYRQHPANDTGARQSLSGVSKRLKLIKNGWYGRQLPAIADLCAAAAPSHPLIADWAQLLRTPRGLSRRVKILRFCLKGARRRKSDNLIVVLSALIGWI